MIHSVWLAIFQMSGHLPILRPEQFLIERDVVLDRLDNSDDVSVPNVIVDGFEGELYSVNITIV